MGDNLAGQVLEKGIRVVVRTRHGVPPDMVEAELVEAQKRRIGSSVRE